MISLDKYNDTKQDPTSYNQAVNGPYSDLWKDCNVGVIAGVI